MNSIEWQRGYDAGYAAGMAATRVDYSRGIPVVRVPADPAVVVVPAHTQWTEDKPFTLEVDGTTVGHFELISYAVDELRAIPEGHKAVIYDHGKVADYRGGKARFKFGRTQWSRA